MSDVDTLVVTFQTQLSDVMETVIKTAMFEVTRLVEEGFLEEVKRRRQEVEDLRGQLQVLEGKMSCGKTVDCPKDDVEVSSETSGERLKEQQEDVVGSCVKTEDDAVDGWTRSLRQEVAAETKQAADSHGTETQENEEEDVLQAVDVKEELNRPSCSWSGAADGNTEPESHSAAEITKAQPTQTQVECEEPLRNVIKQEPQILTAYVFPEGQEQTHMDTDPTFEGDSRWAGLTVTAAGLRQSCRLETEKDCDTASTTQPEDELANSITADANVLLAQCGDQVLCSPKARLQNNDELGVTIKQEVTVNYDVSAERKHKEKTMRKSSTASLSGLLRQQRPSLETFKQNRFSHKATVQEVMRLHSKVGAGLRLQAALQHLHRPMKRSPHTLSSNTTALSLAHSQAANISRIPSTSKATPPPLSVQRGQLGDRQAAAHNRTGAPWVSNKTQHQSVNSHHTNPLPHQDSHPPASPRQLLRCGQCGKCFPHPSNLKAHLQTHTGERPFCCSLCGRSFTKLSNLKAHRRVHTGERPYCCLACGKRFTQKCNLKRHQRIHLDV